MEARNATLGALLACLLLSGCAGGPQTLSPPGEPGEPAPAASMGSWKVEQTKSRLTDKLSLSASVLTSNVKISSSSGRFHSAVLSISCITDAPTAMIYFGWPIGRTGIAVVSYRAGQNTAQRPNAKFIGTDAFTIEGPEARTFINEISSSSTLYIQVSSMTGSQATADFNVTGAQEAASRIISECPFPSSTPAPARTKKR